jgi:hypothetical protein
MASDSKLPLAIFSAIVIVIAIPFLVDSLRERNRPMLHEARIVTATPEDPVFREGWRRVSPTESVDTVLALRIGRRGLEGRWFAPVDRLVIDGREVEHEKTDSWPENGRTIRVFWFSVESNNLGGSLGADNAGERLSYRTFLAPEMGRGLRADRLPDTHNDDHIGSRSQTAPEGAGTMRLYARVEVVESDKDVRPIQVATSRGVESVLDPGFPTVARTADLGEAIDQSTGELFRLPGFEPQSETGDWNDVTSEAFGVSFTELVERRFLVSSSTLAAVAVSGRPVIGESSLAALGELTITPDRVFRRGRSLKWGHDVMPADLLRDKDHWWVLLGDDGNGELDPADPVLHCWGRPPERTTLWASFETESATVEHLRYGD